MYRNADESKLFPNEVEVSSNWATEEGQIAINAIESSSDTLRTTKNLLDYSISLSPTQINALKEYNAIHRNYVDEEIFNCEIYEDDTYRNCVSNFLEILRGNTAELGVTQYGTLDPEYNGSKYFGND